jgi:DNA-binding NarL/FixJ family response regulator
VADDLALGREDLARGAWEQARERFRAALATGDDPAAWEGLSWAAWWLGDESLTLEARERAFRGHRAAGDAVAAARMATWLASDHLDFRGDTALAAGWLGRARRLLEDRPPCAEHGWLWLVEADLAKQTGAEAAEVERLARDATKLGRALGVADLEAVGLGMEGGQLVRRGEVGAGMRVLDEASAMATAEEFQLPVSAGWTLCCVVSACEGAGDLPRAEQWCAAMHRVVDDTRARNLTGICRSAYGNVLATCGDWAAAEAELVAAVRDLEASRPAMAAAALVRLGALRARQERTAEARELFERAGAHPGATVGLGRLALEAGDPLGAADAAERVLRRLPDSALLDRLPALELLARARAEAGDLARAAEAAEAFERGAARVGTPLLTGRAHLVRAELALAADDAEAARRAAEDGLDCFTEGSAPFEAALARVVLARALLALGRPEGAVPPARAAAGTFERLGAPSRAARAAALLAEADDAARAQADGAGASGLGELTARELEVLELVAHGLSDAEIAARLYLSPHTVHRHVANVRTKLRLPSRAAAVAYAARAGLLQAGGPPHGVAGSGHPAGMAASGEGGRARRP